MANVEKTVSAGDSLFLGRYPQTEQKALQPIEWQVLDVKEDRVLVLSRYLLDVKPFHNQNAAVCWEDCALRGWLNGAFFDHAFTAEEQEAICAPEQQSDTEMDRTLWALFDMETATEALSDRVFLLSTADIAVYYPDPTGQGLFCPGASTEFTPFGAARAKDESNWWLRSSSSGYAMAYIVSSADSVGISAIYPGNPQGLRPAMWLHRSACSGLTAPAEYPGEADTAWLDDPEQDDSPSA